MDTTPMKMDLSSDGVGDDNTTAIAEALQVNTIVTSMILSSNSIGYNGTKSSAETLQVNTTVTSMHLSDNAIGDLVPRQLQHLWNGVAYFFQDATAMRMARAKLGLPERAFGFPPRATL